MNRAEAVLQGATHDAARPESWLERKSIAKAVVEEGARRDLLIGLRRAFRTKHWAFHGKCLLLAEEEAFSAFLDSLREHVGLLVDLDLARS